MRELILAVAVTVGVCFSGVLAEAIHKAHRLSEITGEDIPPLAGLFIEVDPDREAMLIQQIQQHLPDYMKQKKPAPKPPTEAVIAEAP